MCPTQTPHHTALTTYLISVNHFYVTLPSLSASCNCPFSSNFPQQNSACIHLILATYPANRTLIDVSVLTILGDLYAISQIAHFLHSAWATYLPEQTTWFKNLHRHLSMLFFILSGRKTTASFVDR
jgi:hypothetical protein